MINPYGGLPNEAFWRRVMSNRRPFDVDPVTVTPFKIGRQDKVATAGSCFAQYISRTLLKFGFSYLVAEPGPPGAAPEEGYGVYPARFGNIYSVRQLLQLFRRAYGLFEPLDAVWPRPDGRWVDPFRPRINVAGFASPEAVFVDREAHFAAVRAMFEDCDVFIFTLGLTETWLSARDGAAFPLAPGVISSAIDPANYEFHNFSVPEVEADLVSFLVALRIVNPTVRVILTVSPVPLIATYEPRHVLLSTTYSKSVLRVAAETVTRTQPDVAYFPSYEIVVGPHGRGEYWEDDLREVRADAVAHVMSIFTGHYLTETSAPQSRPKTFESSFAEQERALARQVEGVICDEVVLDSAS